MPDTSADVPTTAVAEHQLLKQLDPHGEEQWNPVTFGELRGYTFVFANQFFTYPEYFKFLALYRGDDQWWISPLYPNLDHDVSHHFHLVTRTIGEHQFPILCGPRGRRAQDLRQVREFAAKWSVYVAQVLNRVAPGFSY